MKRPLLCFLICGLGIAVGCSPTPTVNAPESPQSSATPPTADSKSPPSTQVTSAGPGAPGAVTPAADSAMPEARWLTSLPEAQALAQKEKKLVLVDFTGSDWCVWCKKLDADIFSKSEFADYARKRLVLVQLDFPSQKPQPPILKEANEALMHKYKVEGFPTLLVMKPDGEVVWKQEGYLEGGPTAMLAKLDEAKGK